MYAFKKVISLLKESRANLRLEEDIMMIQGALGVLAILPFAVSRILQGEWIMVILDLLIISGIISLGVYGRNGANFRTVSTLFTLMYTSGVLAVVSIKGPDMLFWAYPTAIGGYFMVRLKVAIIISVLSAISVTVLVYEALSAFQLSGFVVTYLLVCLFSYFFAARMIRDKQKLAEQATIDPLTGASNRRALDDAVESRVALYSRRPAPVSIAIIDIDYFKCINDEYGHAIGDLFLQRFVKFLNSVVRQSEMLFRFGGEEFVVIVEGSVEEANNLSEKIRGLFEQAQLIPDHPVTVSIGVAELGGVETSREWMKRADDALYLAKSSGRNRVCLAPSVKSTLEMASVDMNMLAHKVII